MTEILKNTIYHLVSNLFHVQLLLQHPNCYSVNKHKICIVSVYSTVAAFITFFYVKIKCKIVLATYIVLKEFGY